jgi:hypothetical protein
LIISQISPSAGRPISQERAVHPSKAQTWLRMLLPRACVLEAAVVGLPMRAPLVLW